MQKIITATGKEYNIEWCGQSTIDFTLRFAVVGTPMPDVISTFIEPSETEKLTHEIDNMGNHAEYIGFTTFRGVDLKPDGSIVVSLVNYS